MDAVLLIYYFPGLLEVKYGGDSFSFPCCVEVVFGDEALGGALHGEDVVGDPVGVETFDGVGLLFVGEVVLLGAGVTAAETTEEGDFLGELLGFEFEVLFGAGFWFLRGALLHWGLGDGWVEVLL